MKPLKNWFNGASRKPDYDALTAPFEIDINFIFENFDDKTEDCKGFSNAIRSLLVDNILRNMYFDSKNDQKEIPDNILGNTVLKELLAPNNLQADSSSDIFKKLRKKLVEKKMIRGFTFDIQDDETFDCPGIHYMLDRKYFDDVFILHDETKEHKEFDNMLFELKHGHHGRIDSKQIQMLKQVDHNRKENDNKKTLDIRSQLSNSWGSLKCAFRFQV